VMARGAAEDVERAKTILHASNPSRIDLHPGVAPVTVPAAA